MAVGKDIADRVPAPDKIGSYKSGDPADDGDEMPGETEGDEDKAARTSAMQEVLDAMGVKGDAEAACDAMDRYLDIAGYRK